ncbi:hypothetical protein [Streptosporangium sp. NBC_01756]|uniref:hypothetical protein n=1 Tax=Streptosporangium sp. NBC_01756 TaxID=2975950 RepID=UPI002DDA4F22|nr:hypothetical protein [Streptosporangium sp. NBC_01756]WSC88783.1 hypothetical protein OIE48_11525 [Streptosporangium sp. NBC_01756]
MGRHGGHGEDAPRNRGKRGPEPDRSDRSVGRRLRPEESAVTETQTGFPGSGWSATTELSEPVWPEEKRRSGGRVRTVVLAVAAMAVVLGGTVAGVQMMGADEPSADCPTGSCLAETPGRTEPSSTEQADPAEQPVPTDEPEKTAKKEKTSPTPSPSVTRWRPGRTATAKPTPTPEATHTARRSEPARRTESPESEPSSTDKSLVTGTRTQEPAPAATQSPATPPAQTAVPETSPAPAAAAAALRVGFGVVKEKEETYTARLVVTADETLAGLTLSLPVGGEVASVSGAGWTQDGTTLVLEPTADLEAGEDLVLTFTAYGRAEQPQTCQSAQAECAVV